MAKSKNTHTCPFCGVVRAEAWHSCDCPVVRCRCGVEIRRDPSESQLCSVCAGDDPDVSPDELPEGGL